MVDDDALREALIAKAASELARLVTWTRAERAVRGDDDRHAAWLDEMIAGLEPLAADVGDVQTSMAMRRVIQRHGCRWAVDGRRPGGNDRLRCGISAPCDGRVA